MKRIISIILVLAMAVAMSLPTFALSSGTNPLYTDESTQGQAKADVEYGVSNDYELLIPAKIYFDDNTIGENVYVESTIGATNVVLSAKKALQIKVSSATPNAYGEWELRVPVNSTNQSNGTAYNDPVVYTVALSKGGEALKNGATVLTIPTLAMMGEQTLYCNTLGSNQSGTYEDYLTFTAQIVNT